MPRLSPYKKEPLEGGSSVAVWLFRRVPLKLDELRHNADVIFPIGRVDSGDLFAGTRRQTAHPVERFLDRQIRHSVEAPIRWLSLHKTLFAFVRDQIRDLVAYLPPGVFAAG
jgi:hypothetical protein